MKKNRVVINGFRSDLIEGLLIQELPPVIKPQMRTQIDEIDGRSGSIVTQLGYSAYEKEMTIGLYGDYDIDQVIRYFNSEGTVIFSNEPDKVYQYQILKEINFARLLRFKTATVTFYVQPFKHSAVEAEQTFTSSMFNVINTGNIEAKPVITIQGRGTVNLHINGISVLLIDLGFSTSNITIDSEGMNAYWDGALLNRNVSGDYNDLRLPIGENTISLTGGSISSVEIDKYSRWI